MIDDADLLAQTPAHPESFGAFYERHERAVFGFFLARTHDRQAAADLTAETFAQALLSVHGFEPDRAPARAWLFGIARNVLGRSAQRRSAEFRANGRVAGTPDDGDDTAPLLERLYAQSVADQAFSAVDPDQAQAIRARVIDERPYAEIASQAGVSEATVRQRVSRGLARMRAAVVLTMLVILLGAIVAIALHSSGDDEQPVAPPAPTGPTGFGVFKRDQRPVDVYPSKFSLPKGADPRSSRHVGSAGGVEYFLIQAGSDVCLLATSGASAGQGGGCTPAADRLAGRFPVAWQSRSDHFAFVFPDGVTTVSAKVGAKTETLQVRDNVIVGSGNATQLDWIAAEGTRQHFDVGGVAQDVTTLLDLQRIWDGWPALSARARNDTPHVSLRRAGRSVCLRVPGQTQCQQLDGPGTLRLSAGKLLAIAPRGGTGQAQFIHRDGHRTRAPVDGGVVATVDPDVTAIRYQPLTTGRGAKPAGKPITVRR